MIIINKKKLYQAMCAFNDECFICAIEDKVIFFNDILSVSILPVKMDTADRVLLSSCVMEFKFVRRWLQDCKGNITFHNVSDSSKSVVMTCPIVTECIPYVAWHPLQVAWSDFHQSQGHSVNITADVNIPSDDVRSMWRTFPNIINWRSIRKMTNKVIKVDTDLIPDFEISSADCAVMCRMDDRILSLHFMNDGKILVEGKFFQMLCNNGRQ